MFELVDGDFWRDPQVESALVVRLKRSGTVKAVRPSVSADWWAFRGKRSNFLAAESTAHWPAIVSVVKAKPHINSCSNSLVSST